MATISAAKKPFCSNILTRGRAHRWPWYARGPCLRRW
jgi:hypothetical protein